MEPVRVAVVPHTHWDREWYATFESFRMRLVDLLDDLLPLVENDPGYAHFLLDGQLAVVDDYLAVRPEREARLRRLVGGGRLSVGPWYTLPDEFCVSGETLIRDLQLGLARASAFGGAMDVGYLPDMFGHVAQMPQILRLSGFEQAVVWRGVPAAIDRTAFWWSAPDGSTVRAEYLWEGYGNGSSIPDDAKALVARIRSVLAIQGDARVGDLLLMNGTDHERPQPWLPRVVAEANDIADDLDIRITSLAAALADRPTADLPRWQGELRSGARANLLMGVASNRVDIKQAAAAAERALERVAEPLCALWLPEWPAGLFADAWLEMVRNAAHDSSCACSIDEVCDAVLTRYRSARHTADGLARKTMRHLAALQSEPGLVIANPTARTRGGVIEVVLPGAGPAPGAQIVEARPAVLEDRVLAAEDARAWLSGWRSQEWGPDTFVVAVDVTTDDDTVALTLHCDRYLHSNLVIPALRDEVRALVDSGRSLRVRAVQEPSRRILCHVEDVPGFGWMRWDPTPIAIAPVQATGLTLSNGRVGVEVDAITGTFTVDGCAGFGRLVESGDYGDTYNYCPPDHDLVVTDPVHVHAEVTEAGPVRGQIAIRATYAWPSEVDSSGHRVGEIPTVVHTVVELRAGEPFVRVSHSWDNRCRDHRVRAVFPVPDGVAGSEAECAFAVVTRGREAEGGPTERALATYPSRRFVRAGRVTVVHDGLLEYELDGDTLAVTLARATGMLSRVDLPWRPLPAGPPIAVEGAQVQGPCAARYAVSVDEDVNPFAMADEVLVPLMTARARGGGPQEASSGRALEIDGAEVSAVVRDGEQLVVRVYNPDAASSTARLPGRNGWVVDLRGRPMRPFEGTVELAPWEIATLSIPLRALEPRL